MENIIESQYIFPTQVFRAQFDSAQELQRAVVPVLLEQEKNDKIQAFNTIIRNFKYK